MNKATHCPPGFHRAKDGVCRDQQGNPYVKDEKLKDTQEPLIHEDADDRTEHEKRNDTLESNKQKAIKVQNDVKDFVARVKNNEFKDMMQSMGMGGLYGLFVIPITAIGSITTLISKGFYAYYERKQKQDKITNYDVGYAEGLNKITEMFDIDKFKDPQSVKAFYKVLDKHLDELYHSKAVRRQDKTSKEYGELMAYYMVLRQTKERVDQWNEKGKKKFGKEFKRCDYADELPMYNEIAELVKLREKKRSEGKDPNEKLTADDIKAIRERKRTK